MADDFEVVPDDENFEVVPDDEAPPKRDIRPRAKERLAALQSSDSGSSVANDVLNAAGLGNRTDLPRAKTGSIYAGRGADEPAPTTEGSGRSAGGIGEPFRRGLGSYEYSRDLASTVLRGAGKKVADAIVPSDSELDVAPGWEKTAGAVTRGVLEGVPAAIPGIADIGLKAAAATAMGGGHPLAGKLVHAGIASYFGKQGAQELVDAAPDVARAGQLSAPERAALAEKVLGGASMVALPAWDIRRGAKATRLGEARAQDALRTPDDPSSAPDAPPPAPAKATLWKDETGKWHAGEKPAPEPEVVRVSLGKTPEGVVAYDPRTEIPLNDMSRPVNGPLNNPSGMLPNAIEGRAEGRDVGGGKEGAPPNTPSPAGERFTRVPTGTPPPEQVSFQELQELRRRLPAEAAPKAAQPADVIPQDPVAVLRGILERDSAPGPEGPFEVPPDITAQAGPPPADVAAPAGPAAQAPPEPVRAPEPVPAATPQEITGKLLKGEAAPAEQSAAAKTVLDYVQRGGRGVPRAAAQTGDRRGVVVAERQGARSAPVEPRPYDEIPKRPPAAGPEAGAGEGEPAGPAATEVPEVQPGAARVEAPPPGTAFRTEAPGGGGGSVYEVGPGGSTTRTKGLHRFHDAGDVGAKEPSHRTVYVEDTGGIGGLTATEGATRKAVIERGGRLYAATWNDAAGKWGLAPGDRAGVPIVSEVPRVGLSPVELWRPKDGPMGREYGSWHPGNKIVEVSGEAAPPPQPEPQAAPSTPAEIVTSAVRRKKAPAAEVPDTIEDVTLTPEQAAKVSEWQKGPGKREIKAGHDGKLYFYTLGKPAKFIEPIVPNEGRLGGRPKGTHLISLTGGREGKGGFVYTGVDVKPNHAVIAQREAALRPPEAPLSTADLEDVPLGAPVRPKPPTMNLGSGLGALGDDPVGFVKKTAKDVVGLAESGIDKLADGQEWLRNAVGRAIERAEDPADIARLRQPNAGDSLTDAQREVARRIVMRRKPEERGAGDEANAGYGSALRYTQNLEGQEAASGDTRPMHERASGFGARPGYQAKAEMDIADALGPEMPKVWAVKDGMEKLTAGLTANKLIEAHDSASRAYEAAVQADQLRRAYDENPGAFEEEPPALTDRQEAALKAGPPSFEHISPTDTGKRGGARLSEDDARRAVADTLGDPDLAAGFKAFGDLDKKLMARAVEAGDLSQQSADNLAKFTANVYLRRNFSDYKGGNRQLPGNARTSGLPIHAFEGSERFFDNPVQARVDQAIAIHKAMWLNEFKRRIVMPAIENPEQMAGYVELDAKNMKLAREALGLDTEIEGGGTLTEGGAGRDGVMRGIREAAADAGVDLSPDELDFVADASDSGALTSKDGTLTTRINGTPITFKVNPEIQKTVDAWGWKPTSNAMVSALRGVKSFVTNAITSNPAFVLFRQTPSDVIDALITSDPGGVRLRLNPTEWVSGLRAYGAAIADNYRGGPYSRTLVEHGAGHASFYGPASAESIMRSVTVPKKITKNILGNSIEVPRELLSPRAMWDWYEHVRRSWDLGMITMDVKARMDNGAPPEQAVHEAITSRPNYGMFPGSGLARDWMATVPFGGAALNGIDTVGRKLGVGEALRGAARTQSLNPITVAKDVKASGEGGPLLDRYKKMVPAGMALITMPLAAMWAKAMHDQDDDVLSILRNGQEFAIRMPSGVIVRARGAHVLHTLFTPIHALDAAFNAADENGKKYWYNIGSQVSTNITPPLAQALVAVGFNKSMFPMGRDLVPASQVSGRGVRLGRDRESPNESDVGRLLGNDVLSGPVIDEILRVHGMKNYLDGPLVSSAARTLMKGLRGVDMGEAPSSDWTQQIPMASAAFRKEPRVGQEYHDFKETLNDARMQRNRTKGSQNLTPEELESRIDETSNDPAARDAAYLERVNLKMQELQGRLTKVLRSPTLPADTKREMRDQLVMDLNRFAKQANEVGRMRKGVDTGLWAKTEDALLR